VRLRGLHRPCAESVARDTKQIAEMPRPVDVQLLPVGMPLPRYSEFFSDTIGASPGIRTFAGRITMVPAFGSTGTAGEKRGVLAAMWANCAEYCRQQSSSKMGFQHPRKKERQKGDALNAAREPKGKQGHLNMVVEKNQSISLIGFRE